MLDTSISMSGIIGTNVTLIDNNVYRRMILISHLNELFDMKFIIGDRYSDDFKQFKIDGLVFKTLESMNESFDLTTLFGLKQSKLFIISDVESILENKIFRSMMVNGSQYGCTIIIFDGLNEKIGTINNIKMNTNILMGSFTDDQITSSYNLYFTIFPTLEIYKTHIQQLKQLNPSSYISVIKSGKRYYSIDERFKVIDINIDSIIDADDTDEMVYDKIIKYDLCISIEI
jgi:hypothetical protein